MRSFGGELSGYVKDENDAPIGNATITARPASPAEAGLWQARSNPAGAFFLVLPTPGDYRIEVQRPGYYEFRTQRIHLEDNLELTISLTAVREVFQSINVREQPSPPEVGQNQRLTGTEVNDIIYPNSHSLKESMTLMPGVLLDANGGIHLNGSSEDQVQYLLNGFPIANPISGQYISILAVEGVRSVDFFSGGSPESGTGSAGVLAIHTETGADTFRYTATNFIPGLQLQPGVRLGNWYPRVGISGPIVRGRVWFSDQFDAEYNQTFVAGLPRGQNTRSGWSAGNLFHLQGNLAPTHLLFADFLVAAEMESRLGLDALDPVSTTQTAGTRQYFGSLKDQIRFTDQTMIELGYAHGADLVHQNPQGPSFYIFSPQGRSGNYFIASQQAGSRDEARLHGFAPQLHLAGTHQIEAGADADILSYDAHFQRTGYQLLGLENQLLSQTTFFGPGRFTVRDTQTGLWIQDGWRISKRLQIDAGLRDDWNALIHRRGWAPRLAVSWAPLASGHTRIAGGFAVIHDAVPLQPFGQSFDQKAITTQYASDGAPAGPPVITSYLPYSNLKLPHARNWTASVSQEISSRLSAGVTYLRRRGMDGLDFVNTLDPYAPPSLLPLPNSAVPGEYQLSNLRRDRFDAVQIQVRQTFSGQYEWMASYTRSHAQSNAVFGASGLTPLQIVPYFAPTPWDAPNRFLGWGYAPLPWKNWAASILLDAHSGFPFSAQQENGVLSGLVNSLRFPFHFDCNLSLERMATVYGHRFALRIGVDNLTNQKNPTAVINTIGSPQYLRFLGFEGRHFVLRIRFFGRASTP